ncbi:MAG TPA: cation diffusion facilitator family transporter [Ktedonobacterales bacterium]|nr:cation diffusion facilitator family transporter [Ktedonobacterales bacterium]
MVVKRIHADYGQRPRLSLHTHSHSHQEGHQHDHAASMTRGRLRLAFFLTFLILAAEVAGGLIGNSLAVLSDAGHVVTDLFALGLAWFASAQMARPANARHTFGYQRVGILAALTNAVTLIAIAVVILLEAVQRLTHPEPVQPVVMFLAAAVGIGVNLLIAFGLRGADKDNLNVRGAFLHVLGDVGASVGVVVAGVIILLTRWTLADPILSVGIAALISVSAYRLVRETLGILMESTPRGVSIPTLVNDMRGVKGVRGVHDLHVWSIAKGVRALSCHAVIDDLPPSGSAPILDRISKMLLQKYQIDHTTIQFESGAHSGHKGHCACTSNALYCDLNRCCD